MQDNYVYMQDNYVNTIMYTYLCIHVCLIIYTCKTIMYPCKMIMNTCIHNYVYMYT